MLNSGGMLKFNLKKEVAKRSKSKKQTENMNNEVKKVLSNADQGLIVMVRG